MKKNFLLPFCLVCICGVSACGSFSGSNGQTDTLTAEEAPVIDATINPYDRCGVNGISCNDTALVNYTKTEADYRATIQPAIEEDNVTKPVTVGDTVRRNSNRKYTVDDGIFSETGTLNLETNPADYAPAASQTAEKAQKSQNSQKPLKVEPKPIKTASGKVVIRKPAGTPKNEIGHADNIELKETKKSIINDGSTYEIVCEEECDDIMDDDVITSEFTEESFDIADYIDDENIEFTDVGSKKELLADVDINEIQVGDDTVLTWEAEEGENLRELLTKWSAMSGWKLLWNTNRNYILSAGVMFKGKFADVSSALIRAFARARPAPIATYYKGNRVIVIETMENENAY